MTTHLDLSTILSPLIEEFQPSSVLIVGETALACYKEQQDTRSQVLKTPFRLEQFANITGIDLAIVSEIIDTLPKSQAMEWLGLIRNCYTQHMIVICEIDAAVRQSWELADFLALGMQRVAMTHHHQIFSYAIENYQPNHDWLNSRHWANPENYDKYRW